MSRLATPATHPPTGRKNWWTDPHSANGKEATATYWEKEEACMSGWACFWLPHTDKWQSKTDPPTA